MQTGNFDLKKYMVDNKLTSVSIKKQQLLEESKTLVEAGYVDDFEDEDYPEDLDFTAGDRFTNSVSGEKARKGFEKSSEDFTDDSDDFDSPEYVDDPDFEDPEDISDSDVESADLVSKLNYDRESVQFEMDDQELNQYLNSFRRPEVATKVLQRALKQAQDEVNDGILKRAYLILDNGFYKTAAFRKGNVIATIRKQS